MSKAGLRPTHWAGAKYLSETRQDRCSAKDFSVVPIAEEDECGALGGAEGRLASPGT
jgi:hypothetical protein